MIVIGYGAQLKYCASIILDLELTNVEIYYPKTKEPVELIACNKLLNVVFRSFDSNESLLATLSGRSDCFIVASADIDQKRDWVSLGLSCGLKLRSLISPHAYVSKLASISSGIIINACAVIQPFAKLQRCCLIHSSSVVEHDTVVEEFTTISPGAILCGWVTVGPGANVGANSTVIQTASIPEGGKLKAGHVHKNQK